MIDKLLDDLIAREGGYSNDPRDAGGETNWGITVRVARANGFIGSMRAMTREQAKVIYSKVYWTAPGFDKVALSSQTVAEELFDTGVNMGTAKASEFLQIALNGLNNGGKDYPDIAEDGDIGAGTLAALGAYVHKRGVEGIAVLLKALNCLQGARYIELARGRTANEAFLYGWLRTRVS